MKKVILVSIFACLWSFSLYAQDKADSLYNEAVKYYRESQYNKALKVLNVIENKYSHHIIYPSSIYLTSIVYLFKGKHKSYKKNINKIEYYMEKIIKSNPIENDSIIYNKYKAFDDNSFNNTFTTILYKIYYKNGHYDKALKYLTICNTEYKISHFCGNCQEGRDFKTALKFVDCYLKLNQPVNAISILFPYCIETPLTNNNELTEKLINVLNDNFLKDTVYNELKNAENTITMVEIENSRVIQITLFNETFVLSDEIFFDKNQDFKDVIINKYKNAYRNSLIYKHYVE
jgi:tetratricopeptide (TPR) repeat protein